MSARQAHGLDTCESVNHGSVISCRCGWTQHVKSPWGQHRKAALAALAAHKREASK